MNRFMNRQEIKRITGKGDPTLWRWERRGIFPKRRKIGPNSVGWPSGEVSHWYEDPEGWVESHQGNDHG
ncbi:MAG: AlpA family phage regulatory protein [Gammaproteobacteria bacterium]|nr:AlpA family phage regulatory protein [Gammaproteobacteria bacterium]